MIYDALLTDTLETQNLEKEWFILSYISLQLTVPWISDWVAPTSTLPFQYLRTLKRASCLGSSRLYCSYSLSALNMITRET
jgi:hypothetical protein